MTEKSGGENNVVDSSDGGILGMGTDARGEEDVTQKELVSEKLLIRQMRKVRTRAGRLHGGGCV